MKKRGFVVVFAVSLLTGRLCAQPMNRDSTAPTAYAISLYQQFLNPEKGLYTGRQYLDYRSNIVKGHPYFQNDGFVAGTIVYDGIRYEQVPFVYDIVKDLVVIWDAEHKYLIELMNEKVDSFSLNGYPFVHLSFPPNTKPGINDGFYRMIYDGKTRVIKKEAKIIDEEIDIKRVERVVQDAGGYYIRKDGFYHPVSNKAGVLRVLRDKKQDLNQYIRKHNLDISANREAALAEIMAYYDSITR
jgi:hypothetical protein